MDKSIAFALITKVDEEKRLVYGRAVQEVPDKADEIFDYAGSKPHFEEWSSSVKKDSGDKSLGNVRAMHGSVAAGKLSQMLFDDKDMAIDVAAKVVDDAEWKKVCEGVYTGFSIGGRYIKKWKDPKNPLLTRYIAKPTEISLVDRPAVPTATFFDIQKADGSVVKQEFKKAADAETHVDGKCPECGNKIVKAEGDKYTCESGHTFDKGKAKKSDGGTDDVQSAEALALAAAEKASRDDLLEYLGKEGNSDELKKYSDDELRKQYAAALIEEATPKEAAVQGTEEEILSFAKLLNDSGLKMSDAIRVVGNFAKRLPNEEQIVAKAKELTEAAGKSVQKYDDVRGYLGVAKELLIKVAERKDTSPEEGEHKYGDVQYADEKNKKYPLDTPKHVAAAARYWGMPKNKAKYSAEDQKTISARIAAAEKEHSIGDSTKGVDVIGTRIAARVVKLATAGKVDLAKADDKQKEALTKKAEWQELRKGLATCGQLMYLLDSLCNMQTSVEMEAAQENDNSPVPAELSQAIHDLGQVAIKMLDEELTEEYDGTEAKSSSIYPQLVTAAEATRGLLKRIEATGLVKRGSRHSAADMTHMQKAHDILSDHFGIKCDMPMKADGTLDREKLGEYLTKINSTHTEEDMAHLQEVHKCLSNLGVKCDKSDDAVDTHGDVSQVKLAKLISDTVGAAVNKALEGSNAEIKKLQEALQKALDRPARGMVTLKAVAKGEDINITNGAVSKSADVSPVLNSDGSVNEVATAIKKAQAAGPVRK